MHARAIRHPYDRQMARQTLHNNINNNNPANFVVFCNRSNFCHPSGSYATEGKKLILIITVDTVIAYITHDDRPIYFISIKPAESEACVSVLRKRQIK